MPVFDGIRVTCFGSALALDLATMVLSDNGAEVVRVEPPGGDPHREQAGWRRWNRGARSIVLDPSAVAGRGTAAALVARADVLLEAWRPGEAPAWGLEHPDLDHLGGGRLVHCGISSFGRTGPLSWIPPYDGAVEARAGTAGALGTYMRRDPPAYRARPNPSYAAAMVAVQSVSAALIV